MRKGRNPGYESLVRNAPDVVFILDNDFTVRYVSPSSNQVLGHRDEEYLGTRFDRHLLPEEAGRILESIAAQADESEDTPEPLLFAMRHADGSWRHMEAVCADLRQNPEVKGIACYVRDVTDRVNLQNFLYHRAFHDPLTNLPNRALFMDRVEQGLARGARQRDHLLAVLFIDLNGFKAINDRWGHAVGDQVLITTGQRLRSCLRPSDTAARLGGDEFAVLLQEPTGESGAVHVARRILKALQGDVCLEGHTLSIEVSIGIATTGHPLCQRPEALLWAADKAMYEVKADNRPGYAVFRDEYPGNVVMYPSSMTASRNANDLLPEDLGSHERTNRKKHTR